MVAKSSVDGGETQVVIQIDPAFAEILAEAALGQVAEFVLRAEDVSGEVSVVITDDSTLHRLNRDFLGEDAPTDVLAFGSQDVGGSFVSAPEAGGYLGDVIVSYPRAVAQSVEAGHSPEREVSLLIVHGVLHLLGYDHSGEDDKAIMWAKQDAILGRM